ncbi:helicase C-terminal domain-containing protein, partial [Escherichia coli]|nr:helicase C-terminal domain-containing protein [Escherichia coli]
YKWEFFVSSRDKAKKLYKDLKKEKIKVSIAMSGLKNEEIENIVENSTFKANDLISTKFLDNGINFKDENIKNLVVMEIDKTTFLQEIGRIRFDINNAPMI